MLVNCPLTSDKKMASQGPVDLSKLRDQVSRKAGDTREKGRLMLNHLEEYSALIDKLETLSQQTQHKVMVPMTSKAFMPGSLVHTNEILVLLGDNWFVETSAQKAAAIARRRVKACGEILDNLQKEYELVEGWKKQAGDLLKEKDDYIDIIEDYDPEAEMQWRERNKENKKRERKEAEDNKSDEDLLRRLEELEIEEALEEQLEAGEDDEDSDEYESEITSEESDVTDDEEEDEDGLSVTNLGMNQAVRPKVSWVNLEENANQNSALEPLRTLKFKHSASVDKDQTEYRNDSSVPQTPADLIHFSCQAPKSILKSRDSGVLRREEEGEEKREREPVSETEPEPAVQDTIVERDLSDKTELSEEPVRKVSKFKASRLQTKPS